VIAVVFLGLAGLLMPHAITGQATYLASDMAEKFAPYRDEIGRPPDVESPVQTDQVEHTAAIVQFYAELRKGHFQTWDPRIGGGAPLGTLPYPGVLSPLNLPHLVFPAWFAITLRAFLSLVVGQWLMYLLLRRFQLHRTTALVGAVAYAFTGTNIVFLQRIGAVFVLPGVLWALHRASERCTLGRALTVGAFVAWCWFEGFPSAFVYSLYVAILWALWLIYRRIRRGDDVPSAARRLAGLGAGVGWGVGLSIVTLLPFLLEVGDRHLLGRREFGAENHLPGIHLFGLLDLAVNGDPLVPASWWSGQNPYESVVLVGSLVLAAAGLGLVAAALGRLKLRPVQRDAWPFFAVLAAAVAFLDFIGGPALGLAYKVPGIANNPFLRTRFLIALGLVVLAAIALDRLIYPDGAGASEERAPRWVSGLVVGGFLIAAATQVHDLNRLALAWLRRDEVIRGAEIAVLVAGVALVAAIVVRRAARGMTVLCAGLVVVLFMQLAWPLRSFTPESPVEVTYVRAPGHAELERLSEGRYRFAATDSNFYPNSAQLFDLFDLRGLALYGLEIRHLIEAATPNAFARDPLKQIIFRDEWNLASPIYDDLALRFFALGTNEEPFGQRVVVSEPQGWTRLEAAQTFTISAPGPLAGVALPLRSAPGCARSSLRIEARSGDRVLDVTSRPAYDAVGDWLPFGLVGGSVEAGDQVTLMLSADPECEVDVGVDGRGSSTPATVVYLDDPSDAVELVATEQAWIYERSTARALVSVHTEWRWYSTQAALLSALATRSPANADVAYLVGAGDPPSGALGTAALVSSSIKDEKVDAVVDAKSESVVILAEAAARGWQVTVDGDRASLLDVDGALMGVRVPAGRHTVRFEYAPAAFRVGAAVSSILGLLGLGALGGQWWRRRRSTAA
jgi:hypothetical protein